MSEANKAALRRFLDELFNRGNLAIVDELVADNFVEHSPIPNQAPGREGIRQIATTFRSAFHFRVRGAGRGRGRGAGASRRPPGSLHPRPRDHLALHRVWHARHLSNLSRPYTNLTRKVVSPIIGTGGPTPTPHPYPGCPPPNIRAGGATRLSSPLLVRATRSS